MTICVVQTLPCCTARHSLKTNRRRRENLGRSLPCLAANARCHHGGHLGSCGHSIEANSSNRCIKVFRVGRDCDYFCYPRKHTSSSKSPKAYKHQKARRKPRVRVKGRYKTRRLGAGPGVSGSVGEFRESRGRLRSCSGRKEAKFGPEQNHGSGRNCDKQPATIYHDLFFHFKSIL